MQLQTMNPIWTIGHSTMPAGDFLELLRLYGIEQIVDVRTAPYSRFAPQFNKLDLSDLLRRNNIAYQFEGERLGGRPSDPTCYRSGAVPDHAQREEFLTLVDYEAVKSKDWFRTGLDEVVLLSAQHRVALMCSEENPLDCHRHRLIASALADRDVEIRHIRKDRSVQVAEFSSEPVLVQSTLF